MPVDGCTVGVESAKARMGIATPKAVAKVVGATSFKNDNLPSNIVTAPDYCTQHVSNRTQSGMRRGDLLRVDVFPWCSIGIARGWRKCLLVIIAMFLLHRRRPLSGSLRRRFV